MKYYKVSKEAYRLRLTRHFQYKIILPFHSKTSLFNTIENLKERSIDISAPFLPRSDSFARKQHHLWDRLVDI